MSFVRSIAVVLVFASRVEVEEGVEVEVVVGAERERRSDLWARMRSRGIGAAGEEREEAARRVRTAGSSLKGCKVARYIQVQHEWIKRAQVIGSGSDADTQFDSLGHLSSIPDQSRNITNKHRSRSFPSESLYGFFETEMSGEVRDLQGLGGQADGRGTGFKGGVRVRRFVVDELRVGMSFHVSPIWSCAGSRSSRDDMTCLGKDGGLAAIRRSDEYDVRITLLPPNLGLIHRASDYLNVRIIHLISLERHPVPSFFTPVTPDLQIR
jgi:hypothetical protein